MKNWKIYRIFSFEKKNFFVRISRWFCFSVVVGRKTQRFSETSCRAQRDRRQPVLDDRTVRRRNRSDPENARTSSDFARTADRSARRTTKSNGEFSTWNKSEIQKWEKLFVVFLSWNLLESSVRETKSKAPIKIENILFCFLASKRKRWKPKRKTIPTSFSMKFRRSKIVTINSGRWSMNLKSVREFGQKKTFHFDLFICFAEEKTRSKRNASVRRSSSNNAAFRTSKVEKKCLSCRKIAA